MPQNRFRVLCVDDNLDSRILAETILKLAGLEVESSTSIASGLQRATSEKFDLFLVDYRLPDGRGSDFCRQLQATNPSVPILIYSGDTRDEVLREVKSAGATDFLPKPIDASLLKNSVIKHIKLAKGIV